MTDDFLASPPSDRASDALSRKLLAEFRLEAAENLDGAEQCLLRLDRDGADAEAGNELFRRIHTIKGSASYVGLGAITELAHALESILALVRQRETFAMPAALVDVCFDTVDGLRLMVDAPDATDLAVDLVRRLAEEKELLGGEAADRADARGTGHPCGSDPLAVFIDSAGQHIEAMQVCLARARVGQGEDPGTVDMFFRAAHSLKGGARYMGFETLEAAASGIEGLLAPLRQREAGYDPQRLADLEGLLSVVVVELARIVGDCRTAPPAVPAGAVGDTPEPPVPPAAPSPGPGAERIARADGRTMRINQGLLDAFMNLVGELVVARNVLGHVEKSLERQSREPLPGLRELRGATQAIRRIADEMQRHVMEMRLVPVRAVFQRFPRIIRDISQQSGKKIDLVLQGEETEIDKGMAEEICDPLVHIVRNAADHGIESPSRRRQAGKPERGTVLLRAFRQGNSVVIEAIDDGAGMDPDAILAKAVAKGMVPPGGASLSREDILNLIFRPGFSMAREVTAISGRGVGMDVVLTNLRRINGSVRVDSKPGEGTRIRLELPLTLAVVEALLVGVGKDTFAIPVEAIRETVKVRPKAVKGLLRKKALTLRGEVVGMETLASLLGLGSGPPGLAADRAGDEEVPVLILEREGQTLGVAVDRLLRQEEVVIKPLVDYLAGLPGLAGASILGDGRALLILDPGELIGMALCGQRDKPWTA